MIRFEFVSRDVSARYTDHLSFNGSCSRYGWRDIGGPPDHEVPNLEGYEIGWSVSEGVAPIANFTEFRAETGSAVSGRIPSFETYWSKACAYLLVVEPGVAHVRLGWPGVGFETMMMGVVTSGMSLSVGITLTFATKPDAPAPTVEAFLTQQEAAFSNLAPVIQPFHAS